MGHTRGRPWRWGRLLITRAVGKVLSGTSCTCDSAGCYLGTHMLDGASVSFRPSSGCLAKRGDTEAAVLRSSFAKLSTFPIGWGWGKYFLTVAVFQEHRAQGKFNMCSCHYSIPFQWFLACLGFMCSWRQESPHQAMKPQKNNDHHHDVSKFVLSGLNTS